MDFIQLSIFPFKQLESQKAFIKWYLDLAHEVAKKSKDESSQVGCVIVSKENSILSIGYNGFPRGFHGDNDPKYHARPLKYNYVIHAEENAICNAAKNGVKLDNSVLFCTHPPCHECTKLIINSGIKYMIFPDEQNESFIKRSKDSFDIARNMCINLAYRFTYDIKTNELDYSPW